MGGQLVGNLHLGEHGFVDDPTDDYEDDEPNHGEHGEPDEALAPSQELARHGLEDHERDRDEARGHSDSDRRVATFDLVVNVIDRRNLIEQRVQDERPQTQQEEDDRADDLIERARLGGSKLRIPVSSQRRGNHQRDCQIYPELYRASGQVLILDDLLLHIELVQHQVVYDVPSKVQHRDSSDRVQEDLEHVEPKLRSEAPVGLPGRERRVQHCDEYDDDAEQVATDAEAERGVALPTELVPHVIRRRQVENPLGKVEDDDPQRDIRQPPREEFERSQQCIDHDLSPSIARTRSSLLVHGNAIWRHDCAKVALVRPPFELVDG